MKIKLTEDQLKNLKTSLNEKDEDPIDPVLGSLMRLYAPIPKSPNQAALVIKKIFNSSGYRFYNLGEDMDLSKDLLKTKDKIRFFEYYRTLIKEKDVRGFYIEGLLAGILDGGEMLTEKSVQKTDIKVKGGNYSVKSSEKGDRFSLGSLQTPFNVLKKKHPNDLSEFDNAISLLVSDDTYNDYKEDLLNLAYGTLDGWIFVTFGDYQLDYVSMTNDELINHILTKGFIKGKTKGHSIALKEKDLPIDNVIKFPTFTKEQLAKFVYSGERGLKTDKIAELFGNKKEAVRYDVLQYIRKNPNSFVEKVVKLYPDRVAQP